MARTKDRIAELDAQIYAHSSNVDQLEHVRLAAERLQELSATIGPGLAGAEFPVAGDSIELLKYSRTQP